MATKVRFLILYIGWLMCCDCFANQPLLTPIRVTKSTIGDISKHPMRIEKTIKNNGSENNYHIKFFIINSDDFPIVNISASIVNAPGADINSNSFNLAYVRTNDSEPVSEFRLAEKLLEKCFLTIIVDYPNGVDKDGYFIYEVDLSTFIENKSNKQ